MRVVRKSSRRFNQYLTLQLINDTVLLVAAVALYGWSDFVNADTVLYGRMVYVYMLAYPITNVTMVSGMYMTCQLIVERYRIITKPYTTFRLSGRRIGGQGMLLPVPVQFTITTLLSIVLRLPTFFEVQLTECVTEAPSGMFITQPMIKQTEFRLSDSYQLYYRIIIELFTASLFPTVVCCGELRFFIIQPQIPVTVIYTVAELRRAKHLRAVYRWSNHGQITEEALAMTDTPALRTHHKEQPLNSE